MVPVIEAVPNLSLGRDPRRLDEAVDLVQRCGAEVLNRSSDPDHNRSVLTVLGSPAAVEEGMVRLAAWARDHIDLREHRGVHPRVGALDVLPFVPLSGVTPEMARDVARRVGERIAKEVGVPVWYYADASDPPGRGLAELRRGGFESLTHGCPPGREPDRVPTGWAANQLHPTAGGTCVGARPVLLAWNLDVAGVGLDRLREVARSLREAEGGVPGLRVLALELAGQDRVQISMNLESALARDPFQVFLEVERRIHALGGRVLQTEVIGLAPDNLVRGAATNRLSLASMPGEVSGLHPLGEALRGHLARRVERSLGDLQTALRGCTEPIPEPLRAALSRLASELGGTQVHSESPRTPRTGLQDD